MGILLDLILGAIVCICLYSIYHQYHQIMIFEKNPSGGLIAKRDGLVYLIHHTPKNGGALTVKKGTETVLYYTSDSVSKLKNKALEYYLSQKPTKQRSKAKKAGAIVASLRSLK